MFTRRELLAGSAAAKQHARSALDAAAWVRINLRNNKPEADICLTSIAAAAIAAACATR